MSTKTADITSLAKLTKLEFENSKIKGFHILFSCTFNKKTYLLVSNLFLSIIKRTMKYN